MSGWMENKAEIKKVYSNDSEYFNVCMHFFNKSENKTTSYKHAFFKAILDNLFNVDDNYRLDFTFLFESFSRIYWNLVSKYKLHQKYPSEQGDLSGIETIIYERIEKNSLLDNLDYDSLKKEEKEDYLKEAMIIAKKYVIGALCSSLGYSIYGFDKKDKYIYFNHESYNFLIKYKTALENLNYYSWLIYLEDVLKKYVNNPSNTLATKLDESNKRESLLQFKNTLFMKANDYKCFYCSKNVDFNNCAVDHFIPWSFVKDDQIWNLVISCKECNSSKSNKLPDLQYLDKLKTRNIDFLNKSYGVELERLYESAKYNGLQMWYNRDRKSN